MDATISGVIRTRPVTESIIFPPSSSRRGRYEARGLVRPEINLVYEMTPYSHGNPPWATKDKASEWLANHTPPSAVAFIPENQAPAREGHPAPGGQILVGSEVSEGGSGVAWLNLQGDKVHGQLWIGGAWTGAAQLAHDDGDHPVEDVHTPTPVRRGKVNCGSTPCRTRRTQPIRRPMRVLARERRPPGARSKMEIPGQDPDGPSAGLAVRNGLVVVSLSKMNQVILIDSAAKKVGGMAALKDPRGTTGLRPQGTVAGFLVGPDAAARFTPGRDISQLGTPETLITKGLEDPRQVTLDAQGNIYVSDRGGSNQVKVFSPDGQPTHTIGVAGGMTVGPYHPEHMDNPNTALQISGDGHLWVAETSKCPQTNQCLDARRQIRQRFLRTRRSTRRRRHDRPGGPDPVFLRRRRRRTGMEAGLEHGHGPAGGNLLSTRAFPHPIAEFRSANALPRQRQDLPDRLLHLKPDGWGIGRRVMDSQKMRVARPSCPCHDQANDSPLFGMTGAYSIRWTGKIQPSFSEAYTFQEDAWMGGARVCR